MPSFSHRISLFITFLIFTLFSFATIPGSHLRAQEFSPALVADSLVTARIDHPADFLAFPWVRTLAASISQTHQWKLHAESADGLAQRDLLTALEREFNLPSAELFKKLTAGGIQLSFQPGPPPSAAILITADDPDLLNRAVKFFREGPAANSTKNGQPFQHKNHDCYPLGTAWATIHENSWLAASSPDELKAALDRFLDKPAPPSTQKSSTHTSLDLVVNLALLRQAPDLQKNIRLPLEDAGAAAIFGGWFDLLRNYDRLKVTAHLNTAGLSAAARFQEPTTERSFSIPGFFNTDKQSAPLPLLNPPGTIYSASWFRDYTQMWNSRDKILAPESLKKLNQGDEDAAKQLSVLGADRKPTETFLSLGTSFRAVILQQSSPPYAVKLDSPLPAGCLDIQLRDEARFRNGFLPIMKGFQLIFAFEQGLTSFESEHRGTPLVSLSYADDPQSAKKSNHARYNFRPTYAIHRGHFLFGSTPEAVKLVIDELEHSGSPVPAGSADLILTDRQSLSFASAAQAIAALRPGAIPDIILQSGMSPSEAEREFDLVTSIVNQLGSLHTSAGQSGSNFEYRLFWVTQPPTRTTR